MLNFEKYISESLWANIAAKRARGERPAKPGEKGYPKTLGVKEEIDEGDTGYKPGWMLKKDPELAKKVKDKIDLAKKRQASYGNPAAGKSVKEDTDQLDELSKETLGSYKHKAELSIPADDREYKNRSKGIDKAEKKLKEEIVAEGAVKDLMMDLRVMPAKEFEAKYKMTKAKARAEMRPSSVAEGSGPKEKQKTPYRNINSPEYRAAAEKQKQRMDNDKASELGKKMLAKKGVKEEHSLEEAEQIDELSKKTLGSYVKKSGSNVASQALKVGQARDNEKSSKDIDKMFKRKLGHDRAVDRLTKEDVGQIDELSKKTLGSYVKKAAGSSTAHALKQASSDGEESDRKAIIKRLKGVNKAVNRLTKEETEQLDELSPNLLHRYVKKAAGSMGMHAVDHGKYGDQQKDRKSLNKAIKRSDGIVSASGRMADKANRNEEVEHDIDSLQKHFGPNVAYDAASHRPAMMVRKDKAGKSHNLIRKPNGNYKSSEVKESEINDLAAEYINENNITLEELENMTEEELNELIGAAVGGAFKLGAKAAVGAGRLAGRLAKKAVVNKQGNFRFGAQGKADAEKRALDREKAKDKAIRDRARFAKERQALRDKQNNEKQSNN